MSEPDKRIVAYADRLSAAPGDDVALKVSAWGGDDYEADLVRLVCGDARRGGARFAEVAVESAFAGRYPARRQRSAPGSYARVDAHPGLPSFGVVCALWPTALGPEERVVVGTWSEDDRRGFLLGLDAHGVPWLRLGGDTGVHQLVGDAPLALRRWVVLAASYDGETGRARLTAFPSAVSPGVDLVARAPRVETTLPGAAAAGETRPLWIAATAGDGGAARHFDGKIGALRTTRDARDPEALAALAHRYGAPDAGDDALVGCWDFAAEMGGDRIVDRGPRGLDAALAQLPTRAVMGHRWSGKAQDWRAAPADYDAIHFHSDDVADAGWETDFTWRVPDTLRSGVYAVRLRQGESVDHVPVFVRPPRGRATAALAFLVPTASYLAYANQRLMLRPSAIFPEGGTLVPNTRHLAEHHLEYGGSLYETHSDGSGVHYSSAHRPILNLKPRGEMWAFNADTNLTAWLEWVGEPFDVITDEDLHREGSALLAPYRAIVTGTHPEYHSTEMLDGLEGYLRGGGRLMYLGGNGFYWRIAFSPTRPGVIEVRRAEDGTRAWASEPGEYYHSFNGEYGGLWRRLGRPPQRLVGVGFAAQGFDGGRPYERQPGGHDPRAAFVFEGIEDAATLGGFGNIGGGAAGEEIDRYDPKLGSPPHTLVLASCADHAPGMLRTKEEFLVTMPQRPGDPKSRADMVFFEGPKGGAVFSVGSIAYGGALAHDDYDNEICRLTTNVLRRFLDPKPFPEPGDTP